MVLKIRLTMLLIVATLLVLVACVAKSSGQEFVQVNVSPTLLPALPGGIYDAAWIGENEMAFLVHHPGASWPRFLHILHLKTMTYEEVPIAELPDCNGGDGPYNIQPLPDGRLGIVMGCDILSASPSGLIRNYHVDALDTHDFKQEVIARYYYNFALSQFAFSPDMDEALFSQITHGLHTTISLWLREGGLQGTLFVTETAALAPSWSPNGKLISYIATRDTAIIGAGKFGRADWALHAESVKPYIGLGVALPLVKGLTYPERTAWSPDSRRIAFSAEVDGEAGIWLVRYPGGELERLWPRQAFFSWSPDGTKMLIVDYWEDGEEDLPRQPMVIDVPAIQG